MNGNAVGALVVVGLVVAMLAMVAAMPNVAPRPLAMISFAAGAACAVIVLRRDTGD